MIVLAADTALGACSCAVLAEDRVLAQRFTVMERGHAEALAPMVEAAMREAGVRFADLDRLAVTTGPGTFTGQRVGLAFMRGLRVALRIPLIGLTTLETMQAAARAQTGAALAGAIHDARRGEVYFALDQAEQTLIPASLAALDEAAAAIFRVIAAYPGQRLALAGTAAERIAPALPDAQLSTIRQPDALTLARLARGRRPDGTVPAPLYLRAPDARLPRKAP
jgi:tRNA threonylcarbamoyladenosine biosynthesis protein TsaB